MAKLNLFDINKSRVAISNMPMDTGAATLFKKASASLNAAADEQLVDWQKAVARESEKEGALAGSTGTVEGFKEDDGTIKADYYNQAFKKSYLSKTQNDLSMKLTELADKFPNDANAYSAAAKTLVDTTYQEMRKSSVTAADAEIFKSKWDLDIQTLGRPILHREMEQKAEQIRLMNEDEINSIKGIAYRNAGNFFSNDSRLKEDATMNFVNGMTALKAKLTQVGPDGSPLYSEGYVNKALKSYSQQFFAGGVLANVDKFSPEDQAAIMNGTFEMAMPDGSRVPLLENVGVDDYQRLVVQPMEQNIKHQEAQRLKAEAQFEKNINKQRDMNGFNLMMAVSQPGNKTTPAMIQELVYKGQITPTDGEKALTRILQPEAQDNPMIKHKLEMMMQRGEDIKPALKEYGNQLSSETFNKLELDNQSGIRKSLGPILDIITDKDPEGIMERSDDKIAREDIIDLYLQQKKDGVSDAEAKEVCRKEAVRLQRSNMDMTRRTLRIPVMNQDTKDIDTNASAIKLLEAYKEGRLTQDQFMEEKFKLEQIKDDQEATVVKGAHV